LLIPTRESAATALAYSPHERTSSSTSSPCLFPHENQQQQHLLIPTTENQQQQRSSRTADSPTRITCLFPTRTTLFLAYCPTRTAEQQIPVATPRPQLLIWDVPPIRSSSSRLHLLLTTSSAATEAVEAQACAPPATSCSLLPRVTPAAPHSPARAATVVQGRNARPAYHPAHRRAEQDLRWDRRFVALTIALYTMLKI
jgi:hypothetical protein